MCGGGRGGEGMMAQTPYTISLSTVTRDLIWNYECTQFVIYVESIIMLSVPVKTVLYRQTCKLCNSTRYDDKFTEWLWDNIVTSPNGAEHQKRTFSWNEVESTIMYMHHLSIRHVPPPQTWAPPHKQDKALDNKGWANEPQYINRAATKRNEDADQPSPPCSKYSTVQYYRVSPNHSPGPASNQETSARLAHDYGIQAL